MAYNLGVFTRETSWKAHDLLYESHTLLRERTCFGIDEAVHYSAEDCPVSEPRALPQEGSTVQPPFMK